MAASSTNAAIVVEEEIAESKSAGGGGNVKWSSAKDTLKIAYGLSQSSRDYKHDVLSYAIEIFTLLVTLEDTFWDCLLAIVFW